MLQPLTHQANQSPLNVIADARHPGPSALFVAKEGLSRAWARWRFPWLSPIPPPSHSSSRKPKHCPGFDALPTIDSRHDTLAASSGLLATPALLRRGQSIPAASAPAPGPHTSRIGDGSLHRLRSASVLSGFLRDFFSHRSGDLLVPSACAWALVESSCFSLAASWTYV